MSPAQAGVFFTTNETWEALFIVSLFSFSLIISSMLLCVPVTHVLFIADSVSLYG